MDYYFLISEEVLQKVVPYIAQGYFRKNQGNTLENLEKDLELKVLELLKLYQVAQGSLTEVFFNKKCLIIKTGKAILLANHDFCKAKVYHNKLFPRKHYLPPTGGKAE